MGLKRRVAVSLLHLRERVRPSREAVVVARLAQQTGVSCIIDVGANRGQFGTRMRRAGYAGLIVSCEPVADAFQLLQQAAADDPKWVVQQVAVGAEAGSLTMHVSGNSVSSSFLPMGGRHVALAPESAYTHDEEVPVTTVEALVAEHDLDAGTTMLKADVQGFEWAVLDGAGPLLERLAMVQLEVSLLELYEGQPLLPELIQRLADAGQVLWNLFPAAVDKKHGRLWWGDGVFVRTDLAARYEFARGI